MYTETSERSGLTSVGALEKGSVGVVGGANSGIVRISNCEIREMVMLRYVGMLGMGLIYDCCGVDVLMKEVANLGRSGVCTNSRFL